LLFKYYIFGIAFVFFLIQNALNPSFSSIIFVVVAFHFVFVAVAWW